MKQKILKRLKEILCGPVVNDVPHQPIPPRDKYIKEFESFTHNLTQWKSNDKYKSEY